MPKEMPDIEQQEQLPLILIIYRDNDLFEKYVPEIARILQAKGREVEIKNFPRGAEEDEIEEWYDENLERLAVTEIISDKTARVPYDLKEKGIRNTVNLDTLMNRATKITIFGQYESKYGDDRPEVMKGDNRPDQLREFFTVMMKRILENQENAPNNTYIFTDHILDHVDKEVYTGIAYKDWKGNDVYERKLEELKKTFPEELKKLLTGNGIDAEKIIIKSEKPSPEEFQEIDQAGNWVIIDRHSYMFKEVVGYDQGRNPKYRETVAKAKILYLPTESFYDSARETGLIDIPNKEFSQNLEKVIDEELGS